MKLRSHAKVNLFLRVLGLRPDGYHDIESLFAAIELHDLIELAQIPKGIELHCDESFIPTDSRNLAWRAAEALAVRAGISNGVRITLHKEIPPASGLGGGSGNAAAVLLGLNELWSCGFSKETLHELAAGLGSDVPFFLEGGFCVATGRGEVLTPLDITPELWMVLIKPPVPVSTPWAYSALDALVERPDAKPLSELINVLDQGPEAVAAHLANDFEAAVFPASPEIKAAHDDLLNAGTLGALMSGSGSAVFGIAKDRNQAEQIANMLKPDHPWVRVTRTIREAIEVVPS